MLRVVARISLRKWQQSVGDSRIRKGAMVMKTCKFVNVGLNVGNKKYRYLEGKKNKFQQGDKMSRRKSIQCKRSRGGFLGGRLHGPTLCTVAGTALQTELHTLLA